MGNPCDGLVALLVVLFVLGACAGVAIWNVAAYIFAHVSFAFQ